MVISQLKDVRTASKAFSTAQSSAMQVQHIFDFRSKNIIMQRRTSLSGASKMRTGLSRMLSLRSVGEKGCIPISI